MESNETPPVTMEKTCASPDHSVPTPTLPGLQSESLMVEIQVAEASKQGSEVAPLLIQSSELALDGSLTPQETLVPISTSLTPEELEEYSRSVAPPKLKDPHQLGAWAKPLHFTPPATPPEPSSPRVESVHLGMTHSFWPSLKEGSQTKKKMWQQQDKKAVPNKLPAPLLKSNGSLLFPWAAKMDPAKRNLFRAANPTFRINGTPEVIIPSKVLHLGPENQDEYVIGQFHRCTLPPCGLVHAVVNKLWGRSCKIAIKKHGESSYMFHIPHEATKKWVIERGVWHIDDCLLFVAPWAPATSLKSQEISTLPVWVTLKNIPDRCYSCLGISHIASGLGEPMLTHKPRLDPTEMGEAKILVEVELDKPFPKLIACDDKQGNIYLVEVEYTCIPSTCVRCGNLGHKEKRCLFPPNSPAVVKSKVLEVNEELNVPVVNIANLPQESSMSSPQSATPQEKLAFIDDTLLRSHVEIIRDQEKIEQSTKEATTFQLEATLPLQEVPSLHYDSTFSPLAGDSSAPSYKEIMENTPSNMITTEIASEDDASIDSHPAINTTIDPQDYEPSTHMFTRGGRSIKPTQKVQEMGWTKVNGRGKHVPRGRGNRNS